MDRARRLDRLEDELDPQAAFLRWLSEAQKYPSVVDYARSLVEGPDPLYAILVSLGDLIWKAHRKRPAEDVVALSRRVRREVLFAYYLVVRLNLDAEERLRVDRLRLAFLIARMRELSFRRQLADHGKAAAFAADAEHLDAAWQSWAEGLVDLRDEMDAVAVARHHLDGRQLGGHMSLFPAPASDRTVLRARIDGLIDVASAEGHDVGGQGDVDDRAATIEDAYVRLATASARAAMGEDDAADAVIKPLLLA